MASTTSMIRVNLFLTIPQKTRLDELERDTGLSRAEHARRALDAYFMELQRSASPAPTSSARKVQKAK